MLRILLGGCRSVRPRERCCSSRWVIANAAGILAAIGAVVCRGLVGLDFSERGFGQEAGVEVLEEGHGWLDACGRDAAEAIGAALMDNDGAKGERWRGHLTLGLGVRLISRASVLLPLRLSPAGVPVRCRVLVVKRTAGTRSCARGRKKPSFE